MMRPGADPGQHP